MALVYDDDYVVGTPGGAPPTNQQQLALYQLNGRTNALGKAINASVMGPVAGTPSQAPYLNTQSSDIPKLIQQQFNANGDQTPGWQSIGDIIASYMNNNSILATPISQFNTWRGAQESYLASHPIDVDSVTASVLGRDPTLTAAQQTRLRNVIAQRVANDTNYDAIFNRELLPKVTDAYSQIGDVVKGVSRSTNNLDQVGSVRGQDAGAANDYRIGGNYDTASPLTGQVAGGYFNPVYEINAAGRAAWGSTPGAAVDNIVNSTNTDLRTPYSDIAGLYSHYLSGQFADSLLRSHTDQGQFGGSAPNPSLFRGQVRSNKVREVQ